MGSRWRPLWDNSAASLQLAATGPVRWLQTFGLLGQRTTARRGDFEQQGYAKNPGAWTLGAPRCAGAPSIFSRWAV